MSIISRTNVLQSISKAITSIARANTSTARGDKLSLHLPDFRHVSRAEQTEGGGAFSRQRDTRGYLVEK